MRLAGGMGAGLSGGSIHPSDLVARITGESDLACRPGRFGPAAPNRFAVRLNPRDLAGLPNQRALVRELERIVEATSMVRGRRLVGPVRIWLEADPDVDRGEAEVRASERRGRRRGWAFLVGDGQVLEVTRNRSIIGRGGESELVIPHISVSPQHALIWYEGEEAWIRDLDSEGGTYLDGEPVSGTATARPGANLTFGAVDYLLRLA